jgi:ABC-2 type transport system permease protein
MSMILYIAAPLAFHAEIPQNPVMYFITLAIFIAVSLGAASIIGLAVKDPAKTSMFSIIIFIPSTMLSGIMFPTELLPKAFKTAGKLFPASWGYQQMTARVLTFENLLPLLLIFVLALVLCSILLRRIDR